MEYSISEIAQKCNDADMILVGIGKEFQYDWDILLRNERYQEIEKEIEEKENNSFPPCLFAILFPTPYTNNNKSKPHHAWETRREVHMHRGATWP